jgi:hypothetical protein
MDYRLWVIAKGVRQIVYGIWWMVYGGRLKVEGEKLNDRIRKK